MTIQIALLVICSLQLIVTMAIAGTLSKVIQHITSEPVIGLRNVDEDEGLQSLQDERPDRWGRHMTYDMPNYDGMSPRPKNYDGVGDGILNEADSMGRIE